MEIKIRNRAIPINPYYLTAMVLLLFFFVISVLSIRGRSLTYDEPWHYQYGANILNGDSTRFDDSKMPFSAWNALPAKIASYLPEGILRQALEKMVVARMMTTLFSLLVAWVVFCWSYKLYGSTAAIASLILYVLDPNIIAHSQLVTTDIYGTGMVLFCSYWLWKFANSRRWQDGVLFSVMLGLAQLAKYTSASLYILFMFGYVVYDFPRIMEIVRRDRWAGIRSEIAKYALYITVIVLVSIIIINIGFLFNNTFTDLKDYQFASEIFKSIQSKINFPVPTPYPYLEGLDLVTLKERTNLGFIYIYLLGKTHFGQGFPGYYIVASFLKVPVATQIILIASLTTYFANKTRRQAFWHNEWFLLWLVFFYTIYFNFGYKAQIGLRYYLVVFPLLYVFAGGLFKEWSSFTKLQKTVVFILSAYLVASVISYYPNYLAYFNEVIGERKQAYKYLADSNLDWGQNQFDLQEYQGRHRRMFLAPEQPTFLTETTTYYVTVNRLVGVINGPENYRWLRENFEPIDTVGGSYLVYEITPEQMQELCNRTEFCN